MPAKPDLVVRRALDAIGRKHEAPSVPPKGARGLVEMPGRLLGDGSRRGAATKRRTTVYLPPELAIALGKEALDRSMSMSDVVTELLSARYADQLGLGE